MKYLLIAIPLLAVIGTAAAQENKEASDRTELCRENYAALFGGEALDGSGADPEFTAMMRKFIFGDVFAVGDLDMCTRELITCTALAVMQTLPQLEAHAGAALDAGVSPVELREAIYQCAPFIGFPKTLNAVEAVDGVFARRGITLPLEPQATVADKDRAEAGAAIQQPLYGDGIARKMAVLPAGMGADVARLLTEHLFGDIYTRNGLDLKRRELLAFCALAALEAQDQLQPHVSANIRLGNGAETLTAATIQCLPYIGFPAAMKALDAIEASMAPAPAQNMVRLSRITVDPSRLDEYNAFLKEEIEASMRLEKGVLALYAVAVKERPHEITILEIYADEAAYRSHIRTPHFLKYKNGTLDMVQSLELVDVAPLVPDLKIK